MQSKRREERGRDEQGLPKLRPVLVQSRGSTRRRPNERTDLHTLRQWTGTPAKDLHKDNDACNRCRALSTKRPETVGLPKTPGALEDPAQDQDPRNPLTRGGRDRRLLAHTCHMRSLPARNQCASYLAWAYQIQTPISSPGTHLLPLVKASQGVPLGKAGQGGSVSQSPARRPPKRRTRLRTARSTETVHKGSQNWGAPSPMISASRRMASTGQRKCRLRTRRRCGRTKSRRHVRRVGEDGRPKRPQRPERPERLGRPERPERPGSLSKQALPLLQTSRKGTRHNMLKSIHRRQRARRRWIPALRLAPLKKRGVPRGAQRPRLMKRRGSMGAASGRMTTSKELIPARRFGPRYTLQHRFTPTTLPKP
mmetsp:Transcript_12487/g.46208  ORF Transcript_12487/g.46208 Transcript_12487/m.46208 type:complete len:367 (-) Transcript_12487:995-2095(-)